jgi:Flp pilus assembly protein TadB
MMQRDRRLTAVAMVAADVAIVLVAAYLLTIPAAAIVAIVLGFLFVRWWQRPHGGR